MEGRHEGVAKERIDPRVDHHIKASIERLEEHVPPTLGNYEHFLREEFDWVQQEKERKRVLATPLP